MGDRPAYLQEAVKLLRERAGMVTMESAMYETAPWGDVQQPDYLNQALVLETPLSAPQLLEVTLQTEREIGRIRRVKWGSRVIDIDIIFFNQEVITLPHLKIPHPQMQNRRFVLAPLQEILPGWMHPILQLTVSQLLEVCPDPLPVHKYIAAAH